MGNGYLDGSSCDSGSRRNSSNCFFTAGATLAWAVGACAILAGVVAGAVDAGIQYYTTGEVDWSQTLIAASCGAVTGAIAATSLGVEWQMIANGVIGATQAALMGGGKVDVLEGLVTGLVCGLLGGDGYVHGWLSMKYVDRKQVWSLFRMQEVLIEEGIKLVGPGVMKSAAFNTMYSWVRKQIVDKLEELYENITDKSEELNEFTTE